MSLLGRCFREAVSELFHAYRYLPGEPLLLLSLGVALISEAMASSGGAGGTGAGGGALGPLPGAGAGRGRGRGRGRGGRGGVGPGPGRGKKRTAVRDRNRGVLTGFAFLQVRGSGRVSGGVFLILSSKQKVTPRCGWGWFRRPHGEGEQGVGGST